MLQCIKLLPKKPVYHFHSMWNDVGCKILLKLLGKEIVSTMHDTMLLDKYLGLSTKRMLTNKIAFMLRREKYIAVNNKIKNVLESMKVPSRDISVIPAYIPETRVLKDDTPMSVKKYIEKHDSVILVYGWKVSFDKNGYDIYGFDTALRVYAKLLEILPDTGMVFLIPGKEENKYIENIARTLKIQDKYLLHTNPIKNMTNLLSLISVYFRPSITDGDSILIREALREGVIVVASNVVSRPQNVRVVSNEISQYVAVLQVSLNTAVRDSHLCKKDEHYEQIIAIYKQTQ